MGNGIFISPVDIPEWVGPAVYGAVAFTFLLTALLIAAYVPPLIGWCRSLLSKPKENRT